MFFRTSFFFNLLTVSLRQVFIFLKRDARVAKRGDERRNIAELMLKESEVNARRVTMEAGVNVTAS